MQGASQHNFMPAFSTVAESSTTDSFYMHARFKSITDEDGKLFLNIVDAGNVCTPIRLHGSDSNIKELLHTLKSYEVCCEGLHSLTKSKRSSKKKKKESTEAGVSDELDELLFPDWTEATIRLCMYDLTRHEVSAGIGLKQIVIKAKNASIKNVKVFICKEPLEQATVLLPPLARPVQSAMYNCEEAAKNFQDGLFINATARVTHVTLRKRFGKYEGSMFAAVQLNGLSNEVPLDRDLSLTIWDSQDLEKDVEVGDVLQIRGAKCSVRRMDNGTTYRTLNINVKARATNSSTIQYRKNGNFISLIKCASDTDGSQD